jgi:hypothetical protein
MQCRHMRRSGHVAVSNEMHHVPAWTEKCAKLQDHHGVVAHLSSEEIQKSSIKQASIMVNRGRICNGRGACTTEALQRRSCSRRARRSL